MDIEVYGPYPILINAEGTNNVTNVSDQIDRIYIGKKEPKVQRIGHNALLEQDAVYIGCEADLAAHVLDVQGW